MTVMVVLEALACPVRERERAGVVRNCLSDLGTLDRTWETIRKLTN